MKSFLKLQSVEEVLAHLHAFPPLPPEDVPLEVYQGFSPAFDSGLYDDISLEKCVARRTSAGGASPAGLEAQLEYLRGVTDG